MRLGTLIISSAESRYVADSRQNSKPRLVGSSGNARSDEKRRNLHSAMRRTSLLRIYEAALWT